MRVCDLKRNTTKPTPSPIGQRTAHQARGTGFFDPTAKIPIVGPPSWSADGTLVPPQTCEGTLSCPQGAGFPAGYASNTYVGDGWAQWDATSSGGECGLAYKILPTVDTDQVRAQLLSFPRSRRGPLLLCSSPRRY